MRQEQRRKEEKMDESECAEEAKGVLRLGNGTVR